DPAQIIRVGMSAIYVDRLEGCREALWRVVHDARRGGAVASGITAMIELARDDVETGHWDEAGHLGDEAVQACEAHGYENLMGSCRYNQARVAAVRGEGARALELSDGLVQWAGPRGRRAGLWLAAHVRGLAALGLGDF